MKTLFTKNKSLNKVIDRLKTNLRSKDRVIDRLMEENQRLNVQISNIVDLHLEKLRKELLLRNKNVCR